jgi:hypothetical protein
VKMAEIDKDLHAKIEEAYKKRDAERKQAEEDERLRQRKVFIDEAAAAGITESMLKFIEKYFMPRDHQYWDGRIGTSE